MRYAKYAWYTMAGAAGGAAGTGFVAYFFDTIPPTVMFGFGTMGLIIAGAMWVAIREE